MSNVFVSPNAARPTLSIGRKPLALDAYKAKIKLVEPAPTPSGSKPEARSVERGGQYLEILVADDPAAARRLDHVPYDTAVPKGATSNGSGTGLNQNSDRELSCGPLAALASLPEVKPRRAPFTHIDGAIYPGDPSWSTPAERRAALNQWVLPIAKEVAKPYQTHSEWCDAEACARSHRLSIASAFERRLVRKDVVAVLSALYTEQHVGDPGHTQIE